MAAWTKGPAASWRAQALNASYGGLCERMYRTLHNDGVHWSQNERADLSRTIIRLRHELESLNADPRGPTDRADGQMGAAKAGGVSMAPTEAATTPNERSWVEELVANGDRVLMEMNTYSRMKTDRLVEARRDIAASEGTHETGVYPCASQQATRSRLARSPKLPSPNPPLPHPHLGSRQRCPRQVGDARAPRQKLVLPPAASKEWYYGSTT